MYDDNDIFAGDADIEMAELQDTANREDDLRAHGVCAHGWVKTHDTGQVECLDCKMWFADFDELMDIRAELIG